jgi:predicted ATP-dependent Lon-type protease
MTRNGFTGAWTTKYPIQLPNRQGHGLILSRDAFTRNRWAVVLQMQSPIEHPCTYAPP